MVTQAERNPVKKILIHLALVVLVLLTCGCSAQSPAAGTTAAPAIAEKIHASQEDYDGPVRSDPENSTAWLIRGMYYNNANGQYEEALRSYNRSLELDPGSGLAWYGKGVTLWNMQRFNESATCFENAGKYGFRERS